jgi:ATP-dependent Zn protease
LIDDAYERAKRILTERRSSIDQGAEMLLEKDNHTCGLPAASARQTNWFSIGLRRT